MGGYGGVSLKLIENENLKNIRVGSFLKPENSENLKNIRVGGYGGVVFEIQKFRKFEKYTCGWIRWGRFRNRKIPKI